MIRRSTRPLIVIGICTRQRNALLRRLLESIWSQPVPPNYDVAVIIVDNNDSQPVTHDVIDLPSKFKLTLVRETKPGMVTARNRVVDAAVAAGADWFIGVDDDEYVVSDWLEQFIMGLETLDAPIIVAARNIVYPDTTSPFVERIQQLQEPAGAETQVLSTANFAMHKRVFDPRHGPGLRFDPALNEAGGVDFELMLRAKHQHGFLAVNWPHAVAVEHLDGSRAVLSLCLRRRMFDQVRRYQIAKLHREKGVRGTRWSNAKRIALLSNRYLVFGTAACLHGFAYLLIGRANSRQVIAGGLSKLAQAVAVFPYLLGKSVVNYGAKVNADRSAPP